MRVSTANFSIELRLWNRGLKYVAGADEVGRGSFAGPVVAACVVFSVKGASLQGRRTILIDDSKKLIPKQREIADKWIKENVLAWGIGEANPSLINRIGIGKATKMAFRRAVRVVSSKLKAKSSKLDYVLVDAFFISRLKGFPKGKVKIKGSKNPKFKNGARQLAIINGDQKSISIAAASIIAKVYRDRLMVKLDGRSKYKKYGWGRNKGYGTREHREAIIKYGITKHHRKVFVNSYLQEFNGY